MAISGCVTSDQGIDGWSRIVFEGDPYRARGYSAEVPTTSLTLIGTTTDTSAGDEADYAEVYAIEGVDPEVAVVAVFYWAPSAGEGHGSFDMFLREGCPNTRPRPARSSIPKPWVSMAR